MTKMFKTSEKLGIVASYKEKEINVRTEKEMKKSGPLIMMPSDKDKR